MIHYSDLYAIGTHVDQKLPKYLKMANNMFVTEWHELLFTKHHPKTFFSAIKEVKKKDGDNEKAWYQRKVYSC